MYDAVSSSRSAAWVEELSIAAELSCPVLRTEEAAEWSAAPVSSRASSSFRPADRPSSSIDSLVCLPSSDAVSVTVSNVVKVFPPKLGPFSATVPAVNCRARWAPLRSRGRQAERPGADALEKRRLHFLTQYVHLERRCRCRPLSRTNHQVASRVLSAYLSRAPAKLPEPML
jgi:hypothetical protein